MVCEGVFLSHSESYKFQIITKYLNGSLYRDEAAKLLNVSMRTISRYAKKIKDKGIFGAKHGNMGNSINKKYDDEFKAEIIKLKRDKYYDFNTVHFQEILLNDHGIEVSYSVLWRWLDKEKLVKKRHQRRRKKHVFRPRMPQEGLLLQMDGCHHRFNGRDDWCLISAIDDATSEIPYAEFFDGETTLACMKVLKRIIEIKGVPKAIYTDRAGWSGGQKRTQFSSFQRACEKLGIQVIYANSPEAKGRIERSFRTIQDRLIPELRHNKIDNMAAANKYLNETFLKKYWNKEKTINTLNPTPAYEPLDPWINLDAILCIVTERKIGTDQTVSFLGQRYLIKSNVNYANFNAQFRETLNNELKVCVMDQEVEIEPVQRRQYDRIESKAEKLSNHDLYNKVAMQVAKLSGNVREHQVTGKPLKWRKGKKAS